MKKIIGLIVFVVVVVGGYFVWQEIQRTESTDDAEIDGNVVAISARVAGHVSEVLVEDGQMVKKGEVLVKLDPKDLEIALERAKANLNNELANLQTSRNDVPLTTATASSTLNGAKSTRQDAAEAINYAQQQQNVAQARLSLPGPSPRSTPEGSCTATSNRRTCWSATTTCASSTSASPGTPANPAGAGSSSAAAAGPHRNNSGPPR